MKNKKLTKIEHPAFPQPNDTNVDLWRYLDFDKFEWLINNDRLFFPMAERLGDPLEGTQPVGDLKWWEDQAANAETEEKKRIIEHNQKLILKFSKAFLPNHYVSCWHINSSEKKRMWRCYTKSSESVVIRTTYHDLQQSLPNYIFIGMVRYIDYAVERLPSLNLLEYITHKNISFQFENEVRAVAFRPAAEQTRAKHFQENLYELNKSHGFRFFAPSIELKRIAQEVVLHPKATDHFQWKIADICKKKGLPFPSRSKFTSVN
ncbi:hypothetical protein KKC91_00870 [bacterium]|nr:hypothetical protein [bacterium]